MNRREVSELLTLAALVDNRTVTDEAVLVWHQIVGHVAYDVALEGLRAHYNESTAWLLPAHITGYARRSRLAALPSTMSPEVGECAPGAHRRLPDGTCILCPHREFADD